MALPLLPLLYTSVALFVLQKLVVLLYDYIKVLNVSRKVPGLPGTRLIQGDLWFSSFDEFFKRTQAYVQDTHVKIYVVWLYFMFPYYSVCHPDTAKLVFTASVPKTDVFGNAYRLLAPWIGRGILSHPGGPVWERNRKLLTPAFHFEILKGYVKVFNDVADDFLTQLTKASEPGASVEISKPITVSTLDALLRCAFSYNGNVQQQGTNHPYVQSVHKISDLFIQRLVDPLLYPDFVYCRTKKGKEFATLCDYVHTFSENIIEERKQTLVAEDEGSKRYPDFLDILLKAKDEEGKGLTDEEIRAEADTFLFAGHDTTSSALSWAVYAFAKYPDEQEKVYKEVREVVGKGEIMWDHLSKLNNLHAFIKETMRMYSTVPLIGRVLDEPMTFDGVTLPAGTSIEVNIDAINHRSDIWTCPQEFNPGRFLDKDAERDPFSYVPFSAGSRNCIGQNFAINEQKVILGRLVQRFRIVLDTTHTVEQTPLLVMRTKNGIKVFLHTR